MVKSCDRWEMIRFSGIKVKLLPCLCKVHAIMSYRWWCLGGGCGVYVCSSTQLLNLCTR